MAAAATPAYKTVLLRHGESEWNADNKFTGWFDVDLADTGVSEAKNCGQRLKDNGLTFDLAYTSVLKRTVKTLFHIQEALDLHWIPVVRHWRLNERMYGALTGLNKAETAAEHGEEQVNIWRRSYDVAPPEVDEKHRYYPGNEPKYKGVYKKFIPKTESLKDTVDRCLPLWTDTIVPQIMNGRRVLVIAHGNTVRAIIKTLDNVSDKDISDVNIPSAIPLVYEFDRDMKPLKHYYLASDQEVQAAIDRVTAQGKMRSKK